MNNEHALFIEFSSNQTTCRIQIVTEGKKRKLIIKDCKIDDTANITVKVPGDESSAPLKVARKSTHIRIIMLQTPVMESAKIGLQILKTGILKKTN